MVEQLDIEQLPGCHDLHREGHIGRRGRRIPRRVVMDGNEGSGLLADRVPEDLTLPSSTCGSQEQASGQRVRTAGAESQDVVGKRNVSQSVAVTTPPQWAMARSMAGYGALILARMLARLFFRWAGALVVVDGMALGLGLWPGLVG